MQTSFAVCVPTCGVILEKSTCCFEPKANLHILSYTNLLKLSINSDINKNL